MGHSNRLQDNPAEAARFEECKGIESFQASLFSGRRRYVSLCLSSQPLTRWRTKIESINAKKPWHMVKADVRSYMKHREISIDCCSIGSIARLSGSFATGTNSPYLSLLGTDYYKQVSIGWVRA